MLITTEETIDAHSAKYKGYLYLAIICYLGRWWLEVASLSEILGFTSARQGSRGAVACGRFLNR